MIPRGRARVSTPTIAATISSSRVTGAPAATTLIAAGATARVCPVAETAAAFPPEVEVVAIAPTFWSAPEAGKVDHGVARDSGDEDVPTSA